jgi:hypothetical protein
VVRLTLFVKYLGGVDIYILIVGKSCIAATANRDRPTQLKINHTNIKVFLWGRKYSTKEEKWQMLTHI